jgi:hypothetical protein
MFLPTHHASRDRCRNCGGDTGFSGEILLFDGSGRQLLTGSKRRTYPIVNAGVKLTGSAGFPLIM